jgi:hypothetical protein
MWNIKQRLWIETLSETVVETNTDKKLIMMKTKNMTKKSYYIPIYVHVSAQSEILY